MIELRTPEDVIAAYVQLAQAETQSLFAQGDLIWSAVDQGFKLRDIVRTCASHTRRLSRTVYNRYQVSNVFPPDKRNPELDWSLHQLCAATDNPDAWLEIASAGYDGDDGQHHDYSYRTLKDAIKASGGNPDKAKPVYLVENADARLEEVGVNRIVIVLPHADADLLRVYEGAHVLLTVVQAPAIEPEAAA